MARKRLPSCPPWCVADHSFDDVGVPPRHRSDTLVIPGVAIAQHIPHAVESIELLIELHSEDNDPVVGVYIGDGIDAGIDITTETAFRLVRRLMEALESAGESLRS